MLIAYTVLLIIFVLSFVAFFISIKAEGAASDTIQVFLCIFAVVLTVVSLVGLIISSKTGKKYRSEYDKIIQNIESDKTKVFKEDDEITDIYITVNGEEYHFDFKED